MEKQNNINWDFTLNIDSVSHLHFGMSEDDLDKTELKEAKNLFREIKKKVTDDKEFLKQMSLRLTDDKGCISIENIQPSTLMPFCQHLIAWVSGVGEPYLGDLECWIDLEGVLDYLEENDDDVLNQFNQFLKENFWD